MAENRGHDVGCSTIGPLCEGIRLPRRESLKLAKCEGRSRVMGR
jgi:hypothetical protein